MHFSVIDILAASAAFVAVWMCGATGVSTLLRSLALQTIILATITAIIGIHLHLPHYLWLAGVVLCIKALAIPYYLSHAAARLQIRRDDGVMLHSIMALFAGVGILVLGYFLAPRIAVSDMGNVGAAGMAISVLFVGMLIMMTRRLALTQVLGFLVLENGIFLYGLTQTHGMPLMIEMGVVFDVLVSVLVAGVVIFRINRSFEHIDVSQMRGLRH